jgi:peptide deformylase
MVAVLQPPLPNHGLHAKVMARKIIHFPHPTLRHESKTIKRVDAELRKIIREMFDLMYLSEGIGLAANQVDLPLRLFVVNLEAKPDEGEELVFINPVVSHPKGSEEAEEGCLSLPGLYGPVTRPKQVRITAYRLSGEQVREDVTGLMARVVQHELDHLDGVLFTDRMSEENRATVESHLAKFEDSFRGAREAGEIEPDDVLAARRQEWEARYC